MSIPSYNRNKYYRIMDRAQSNYAYQLKRLTRDKKRADFILIYYSLALIVYSLSAKFYPLFFDETWISYSSIILSTIVLIYSVVISHAEYSDRIASIQHGLNEVKRLKRELGSLPEDLPENTSSISEDGNTDSHLSIFNRLKNEYDQLVSSTEVRDDLDFYYTILQLSKRHKIPKRSVYFYNYSSDFGQAEKCENKEELDELIGYIAENNPLAQLFHVVILRIWHIILYLTPLAVFAFGTSFVHDCILKKVGL